MIFYNLQVISIDGLSKESIFVNSCLPILFLFTITYINYALSGHPFISSDHQKQILLFKKGMFIFGIGRLIVIIADIFVILQHDSIANIFFVKDKDLDI
jgi:hypothetical protein